MKLIQVNEEFEISKAKKGDKAQAYESVNEIRSLFTEMKDNNLADLEKINLEEGELFIESIIDDHFITIRSEQYCIIH